MRGYTGTVLGYASGAIGVISYWSLCNLIAFEIVSREVKRNGLEMDHLATGCQLVSL